MARYKHSGECKRYGVGGSVRRAFVTLIDAGMTPEGKGPFLTRKHLDEFVREVIACRPATTQIVVSQLTWNDELWVECGREMVAIDEALASVED